MKYIKRSYLCYPALIIYVLYSGLLRCEPLLTIVTEHFPPYQIQTPNGVKGLSIDIVSALNQHLNIDSKVMLLPWSRAYNMALKTPNTMIMSIARTEERQHLFHWIGDLPVNDELTLWTINDKSAKKIDWHNLQNSVTALPRKDSSIELLLNKGLELNKHLIIVNTFEQVILLLLKGRIDYIIAGKVSLDYQIRTLGYGLPLFKSKVVEQLPDVPLAIALNLHSDIRLVEDYQRAYKYLADNSVIQKITNKWLQ
jgi:polar amino acid transport system substrate-binding protein